MRQFVMTMTMGLVAAGSAWAGPHEDAVEELLEVTRCEEVMQTSMNAVLDAQLQGNPMLRSFEDVMVGFLNEHMSYEAIKPELVQIYVDAFTVKEVKGLIKFYKSPLGQRSLDEMPNLMTKGAEIGMARVQANMGDLQAAVQARMAEMHAEAGEAGDPAPAETVEQ